MFPEDGDVGDGGGEEEGAVAADRNHLGRVEAHVARQLWIEWRNGEGGQKMRLGKLFIEIGRRRRAEQIFSHSFHVSSS